MSPRTPATLTYRWPHPFPVTFTVNVFNRSVRCQVTPCCHRNANVSFLAWLFMASPIVTTDGFEHEFVALEAEFLSILECAFQNARITPNAKVRIFFKWERSLTGLGHAVRNVAGRGRSVSATSLVAASTGTVLKVEYVAQQISPRQRDTPGTASVCGLRPVWDSFAVRPFHVGTCRPFLPTSTLNSTDSPSPTLHIIFWGQFRFIFVL